MKQSLSCLFFIFFLFYHDTYGMKYTHFIEEEGELYRVLPLLDIQTVHRKPFGHQSITTNPLHQSQLESSC